MKRKRRTSWVTEIHTEEIAKTKEECLADFIYKLEIANMFLSKIEDETHIKMLEDVISNIKKKYPKMKLQENPYHPSLEKDSEERYRFAASSWYRMAQLSLEQATGLRIGNFSNTLELTTI